MIRRGDDSDMRKLLVVLVCVVVCINTVISRAAAVGPVENHADDQIQAFSFHPKVSSVFLEEIFGEAMVQVWFNLVDAVLAGEDTFACPDKETYDWVMGQFPDRCFPVLTQLIEPVYGEDIENGTARFVYKTSGEEAAAKLSEFEALVEEILNKTMREDYSDLEKALSLYRYFYSTYEYDYDTFEKQQEGDAGDLSGYRFLIEGSGICQEISTAYSYLLLQAGVDATIMMGESQLHNYNHQWSYVRINGNNYHIDPTYVLGEYGSLEYFMMTDEKRSEEFLPEDFVIASNYTQEHAHPEYAADDDTFRPLWDTSLDTFDHDEHIIYSWAYDQDGTPVRKEFDYTGY